MTPEWLQNLLSQKTTSRQFNNLLVQLLESDPNPKKEELIQAFATLRKQAAFKKGCVELLPILVTARSFSQAVLQLLELNLVYQQDRGRNLPWAHPHLPHLLVLAGRSEFLMRRLLRYPHWVDEFLSSAFILQEKSQHQMLHELHNILQLSDCLTPLECKNRIRRFKYQEYIRITVRDLAKLSTAEIILRELTAVGVACLQMVMAACWLTLLDDQGRVDSKLLGGQIALPFTVLGMGKLGGQEINYSSDIDLIFLYEETSDEHPEKHSDNNANVIDQDRMSLMRHRLAKALIEWMSEKTEEGFICRVDMRLRPGGNSAPLVQSTDEAEWYYARMGELWERQAMIKAFPVAGDIDLGQRFLKMLRPWIFSKLIDESTLEQIKAIKGRIEEEHLKQNHLNVKLGVGGIREIEFFVQTFQLLYGGSHPTLQTSNTLNALKILRDLELIRSEDADTLSQNYLFLRALEHCIQLDEEQQTHVISPDPLKQKGLARCLGYVDQDPEVARLVFLNEVSDVMAEVNAIFHGLFNIEYLEIEAALRNNAKIKRFTKDEKLLLQKLAIPISALIKESPNPNLSFKFQQLFEAIGAKLNYYRSLVDHPSKLRRLTRIAETSEFLWSYLLNHLDLLNHLEVHEFPTTSVQWQRALEQHMQGIEDEESWLDALREFKHSATFMIGSAEMEGLIGFEKAREQLTILAEMILQAAYRKAQQIIIQRFGLSAEFSRLPFYVLGMGKIGGAELTYHSDLDLVFVYQEQVDESVFGNFSAQEIYVKLVQRLISLLSSFTRCGFAYKLDTRLRPSGNAGVLVTSLNGFFQYHLDSLPWEHQALIKARCVAGHDDPRSRKELAASLNQAVYQWPPPENLAGLIHHLRHRKETELAKETTKSKNIKEGYGGLLDIEYSLQYLQLLWGKDQQKLHTGKTLEALDELTRMQILTETQQQVYRQGYIFLRQLESYLRLLFDQPTSTLNFEQIPATTLMGLFNRQGYQIDNLQQYYLQITKQVRLVYLEIMKIS